MDPFIAMLDIHAVFQVLDGGVGKYSSTEGPLRDALHVFMSF